MSVWRELLPVHPAADCLPMMSAAELKVFAADIKKSGLLHKIDLVVQPHNNDEMLLDGRNRMEALELLGIKMFGPNSKLKKEYRGMEVMVSDSQAIAHVTSANVARRHLTGEQKRATIAALLKASPEKSSRALAKDLGVSHTTVDAARKNPQLATGGQLKKTVGLDGRSRTSTPKKRRDPNQLNNPDGPKVDQKKALAVAELRGWTNRALEAAQLARWDENSKAPKTKEYRKLVVDAINAWTSMLKAVDKKS